MTAPDEREPTMQELRDQIALLRVESVELHAGLCAVLMYVRSQPSYDAALMARFYDEAIEKLGIGPADTQSRLESLRAYLASVKGPVQ